MHKAYTILFTLLIISCTTMQESYTIHILHPGHFEFTGQDNSQNEINYYFLSGEFKMGKPLSAPLLKKLSETYKPTAGKTLSSVYVYRETGELNQRFNKDRSYFDGHEKDLLAYIRYSGTKLDIYYLLNDGKVVYDGVENKETNFEFDQ